MQNNLFYFLSQKKKNILNLGHRDQKDSLLLLKSYESLNLQNSLFYFLTI